MPTAELMTAQEFLALPIEPGRVWNLVEGELVVNEPGIEHQGLALLLAAELARWTQAEPGRGRASLPLDVRLDERNVFKPDVLWYSEERAPRHDDPRPDPMPDLAVEVRSPSTWRHDIGAKKRGYERGGLQELWLVDTPAREVLVFRRSRPAAPTFDSSAQLEPGEALTSPLLPGFAVAVADLFAAAG